MLLPLIIALPTILIPALPLSRTFPTPPPPTPTLLNGACRSEIPFDTGPWVHEDFVDDFTYAMGADVDCPAFDGDGVVEDRPACMAFRFEGLEARRQI